MSAEYNRNLQLVAANEQLRTEIEASNAREKLQTEAALQRKKEAAADSSLNHTLKNYMGAGMSAIILLSEAADEGMCGCHICSEHKVDMQQGKQQLLQGLKWVHHREVFHRIQQGAYTPDIVTVVLSAWSATIAGIYDVEIGGASEQSLSFDVAVTELVIGDAISNARKYGDPKKSPWVQLVVGDADELTIRICNIPRPGSADITDDMAAQFLEGGKGPTRGFSTSDEFVLASTGIGLQNAVKAATSVGGSLSLSQTASLNERTTTLEMKIPAQKVVALEAVGSLSLSPRQPCNHHLLPLAASPRLQLRPPPAGLTCIVVDDQPLLRKLYTTTLFKKNLKAAKVVALGKSDDEIDSAANIILGKETLDAASSMGRVHIVTLDQDLGRHKDGRRLLGTDIAAKLHEQGFQGLVCMLSGGSAADLAEYSTLPGVDLALSKSSGMKSLVQAISEGYWAKVKH